MTPHLDELIALCKHPNIQGRRGEWKVGDLCYRSGQFIFLTDREIYSDSAQEVLAEKQTVWLPPLSDPIQPERGLLNWVKGEWSLFIYEGDNPYTLKVRDGRGWTMLHDGPTPEIAVAKAIVGQKAT